MPVAPIRLFAFVLLLAAAPALAQTGTIRGRVIDARGLPLIGAVVEALGTGRGDAAESDGQYVVDGLAPGAATLRVRLVGYEGAERAVAVVAGGETVVDFALAEDPLGLGEAVVTGLYNAAEALSSSTAITTLAPRAIERRQPRGTADLLRAVPGVQVTNTTGEIGAQVTVRGLPQAAESGFRYVALQEDGLPVFEAPGLIFAFPDAMLRLDETVARVETVRGGSAAVFASNTPGGIVNVVTETGGPDVAGTIRTQGGAHGLVRQDLAIGGPLAAGWRFAAGGFYRYDRGVRDPGFAAGTGGQVRASVTRRLTRGYARLYGRVLDERNVWFLGIPLQNFADPQRIAGGPDLASGTTFSAGRLDLTIPDAFNPGETAQRGLDGNTTRYRMAGVEAAQAVGAGWDVTLRARALRSDNRTNLMVEVADAFPIARFGAPGLPAAVPRIVRFVDGGGSVSSPDSVATLNGNGLMTVHGIAFVEQPVTNLIANVQAGKRAGRHTISAGVYASRYTSELRLTQHGLFLEVADQPRRVQIAIPTPGGVVGLTPADGFAAYNTGFWNLDNATTLAAAYAGDTWAVSPRVTLDGGLRLDQNWSAGRNERPVVPGRVANGQTVGQLVPAGVAPFTPTPEQTRAGQFGSGIYRTWDYSFTTLSGSLGANWRVSDRLAVYARGSRGSRAPTVQQWTFQTSDGSQVTGETNRGEVETTLQAEAGVKLSGSRAQFNLTGFAGRSTNFITTLQRGRPDGSFAFLPIPGDTRTFGVEVEAVVAPLPGLQVRATATAQDPRFTRFRYEFFVPGTGPLSGPQVRDYSGNRLNDVARLLGDLTADYTRGPFDVFANVRYVGERAANRPGTIRVPGYAELAAGVGVSRGAVRLALQGVNLTNTRAIQQLAQRTGEDIVGVNADGSATTLVTTGAAAGTTTTGLYTTGIGILPRQVLLSAAVRF